MNAADPEAPELFTPGLSARTGALLAARGWRLACVESCTGGGVAQSVTDIAGSSAWFDCGWVVYSNEAKSALLGVAPELIAAHGAVSAEVVAALCAGALARSPAEIVLAISGVAGPGGGSAYKPVGTVWIAWQVRGEPARCQRFVFGGDRAAVRQAAVTAALLGIGAAVERNPEIK